jgi:DNA-binding response OmpR family regulator
MAFRLPSALSGRFDREAPVSTILFIDDYHSLRTVFAETLRSAGHMVLEAGTLPDAEYLLKRQPGAIDLLIVEAVLTTANGVEVARRLQASHPEMQVLFVSEESGRTLTAEGLLPKGAHFLQKPFDTESLLGQLQQLANAAQRPPAEKPVAGVPSRRVSRKARPKTLRSHH